LYWKQRVKAHWLEKGDCNTRFFHQYASERRSRIKTLVQEDGRVVEQRTEMRNLITNEYKNLFASHAGNNMDDLLQHVHPKVSADMNRSLLSAFTEEEVKQGVDAIGDLKAPGADGMPSQFYKKH